MQGRRRWEAVLALGVLLIAALPNLPLPALFSLDSLPPEEVPLLDTRAVGMRDPVEVVLAVDTNPLSLTGPFGPTVVMGIAGLAILIVAFLHTRRK
ncbi:MAG: hypothetical protein LN413_05460 [Candidatus Thermoplasmatota archaeon]|nr:hypothetical protein [Candidatus Thermoplasmatota archaeon]